MVNVVQYLIDERSSSSRTSGWLLQATSRRHRIGRAGKHPAADREADRAARAGRAARARGRERRRHGVLVGGDRARDSTSRPSGSRSAAKRWCGAISFCRRRGSSNCPTARSRHDTSSATCSISKCPTGCCRRCAARRSTGGSVRAAKRSIGDRVGEIAAELAMHFEQARDPARAVKYLLQAARERDASFRAARGGGAGAARPAGARLAAGVRRTAIARRSSLRMILGVVADGDARVRRGRSGAGVSPCARCLSRIG